MEQTCASSHIRPFNQQTRVTTRTFSTGIHLPPGRGRTRTSISSLIEQSRQQLCQIKGASTAYLWVWYTVKYPIRPFLWLQSGRLCIELHRISPAGLWGYRLSPSNHSVKSCTTPSQYVMILLLLLHAPFPICLIMFNRSRRLFVSIL